MKSDGTKTLFTVLVIEDHPDQRELLELVLQREGYRVITAGNGEEALEKLAKEPVDIALSDIMMPKMDGLELLHKLRSNPAFKNIYVILITARIQEGDRVRGLDLGADDYINKPFSFSELLARARVGARVVQYQQDLEYQTLLDSLTSLFNWTSKERKSSLLELITKWCLAAMTDSGLSEEEKSICDAAKSFARKDGKRIAAEITDTDIYPPDAKPVSVFMAGSPGAGKTEASKALLAQFEEEGTSTVRIDPDELRGRFEGYSGDNAWLFQPATSILVDKIHDKVLKNEQNFLLDGTLANYDIAKSNIERSLKRGRFVQIYYVYQEPEMAWRFVKAREELEGRRILPEHFIEQYFAARRVVNQLKIDFGKDLQVDLLLKNLDASDKMYKANVDQIDNHIPEKYTEEDLVRMIDAMPI